MTSGILNNMIMMLNNTYILYTFANKKIQNNDTNQRFSMVP